MPHRIRLARPDDAARIAELAGELGYPAAPEQVVERLAELAQRAEHAVFVLEEAAIVQAFVHVEHVHALVSAPHVEVAALVVASVVRSRGHGRALLEHAQAWARARGVTTLRLRSRSSRERAHAFYRRAGYVVTKTQLCFERGLDPRAFE
ncbi:MAG: GNAT family N-acetyltransferase [Planctomycetes bacterium]|nr:GNAT family N-acetyltransferase [Planctomycetota bacterium]